MLFALPAFDCEGKCGGAKNPCFGECTLDLVFFVFEMGFFAFMSVNAMVVVGVFGMGRTRELRARNREQLLRLMSLATEISRFANTFCALGWACLVTITQFKEAISPMQAILVFGATASHVWLRTEIERLDMLSELHSMMRQRALDIVCHSLELFMSSITKGAQIDDLEQLYVFGMLVREINHYLRDWMLQQPNNDMTGKVKA